MVLPGDISKQARDMFQMGLTNEQVRMRHEWEKELSDVLVTLHDEEFQVVLRLAKRVKGGQLKYGALNLRTDKRDLAKEKQEELDDAETYDVCEELRDDLLLADPLPAEAPPRPWTRCYGTGFLVDGIDRPPCPSCIDCRARRSNA